MSQIRPRFSPVCCGQRLFYLDYFNSLISDLSCTLILSILSLGKKINQFKISNFVDTDNTFHNTIFKTLNGALSSDQTFLRCNLHTEVWSCVRMGNSSNSTFLHQRDLEIWDSHVHPRFPPLYPLNCQESCNFCSICKIFTPYFSM